MIEILLLEYTKRLNWYKIRIKQLDKNNIAETFPAFPGPVAGLPIEFDSEEASVHVRPYNAMPRLILFGGIPFLM